MAYFFSNIIVGQVCHFTKKEHNCRYLKCEIYVLSRNSYSILGQMVPADFFFSIQIQDVYQQHRILGHTTGAHAADRTKTQFQIMIQKIKNQLYESTSYVNMTQNHRYRICKSRENRLQKGFLKVYSFCKLSKICFN